MFTGDLAVLSNFYMHPFEVPVLGTVASGEHAFNAFKTADPSRQRWVLSASTPGEAKRRGRSVTLRPDWDSGFRFLAMQMTLRAKFAVPELLDALGSTGDLVLVETNLWHDNFWGSCLGDEPAKTAHRPECAHPGKNMLGEMLMAIRAAFLNS